MPEGIVFEKGKISGTPRKAGKYNIELSLDNRKTTLLEIF